MPKIQPQGTYPKLSRRRIKSVFKKTRNPTTKKDVRLGGYYTTNTNYPPQMSSINNKRFYQSSLLERKRTTSGSVPNWRKAISQGGDATTALSGVYTRAWISGGNITASWPDTSTVPPTWYTESVSGDFAFHGFTVPTGNSDANLEAEADTKAKLRLNKKAKSFSTVMQGGVLLGELRETLQMLRNPAGALRKGLGEYLSTVNKRSRGSRKKPSSISKIAAESWLEYSFGWIPLFHDIADATKAYQSLSRKHETIRIGAGGEASKLLGQSDSPGLAYINYCYYRETYTYTARCHVRYTGAIRVSAGVNSAAEVMDRFGLTFKEFVPTAWELIPWSFLADYFTNIGDILSYDNTINQNLAWLCRGMVYEEQKMRNHSPDFSKAAKVKFNPGGLSLVLAGGPSYAIFQRRSVSRGKVSSMPSVSFADFQFQLPDYWKQFANIGALLGSANAVHPQRFRR